MDSKPTRCFDGKSRNISDGSVNLALSTRGTQAAKAEDFQLGEGAQSFRHRRIIGVEVEAHKEELVDDDDAGGPSSQVIDTPSSSRSPSPTPSRSFSPLDVRQTTDSDAPVPREQYSAESEHDPGKVVKRRLQARFPCLIEGCGRRLTTEHLLRVHMEAHRTKPKPSYPCKLPGCSKKYSRKHDRLRHEISKHGKVCEFKCETCGKSMWRKKALEKHECPTAPGTTRCVWMKG